MEQVTNVNRTYSDKLKALDDIDSKKRQIEIAYAEGYLSVADYKIEINELDQKERILISNLKDIEIALKQYSGAFDLNTRTFEQGVRIQPGAFPLKELPLVTSHELAHFLSSFKKVTPTYIDKQLEGLQLITDFSKQIKIPFAKTTPEKSSAYTVLKADKDDYLKEAVNYWNKGSKGTEKTSFLAEVREDMLQKGIIKSEHQPITNRMLKTHYENYKKAGDSKFPLRVYDIMQNKSENFNLLEKVINNLPVIIGGALAADSFMDENNSDLSEASVAALFAFLLKKPATFKISKQLKTAFEAFSKGGLEALKPGQIKALKKEIDALYTLPKAKNIKEALGTFIGIPTERSLQRLSNEDLKIYRAIQEIGRMQAMNKPISEQLKYGLQHLPDDHFEIVFRKSKAGAESIIPINEEREAANSAVNIFERFNLQRPPRPRRSSTTDEVIDALNSSPDTSTFSEFDRSSIIRNAVENFRIAEPSALDITDEYFSPYAYEEYLSNLGELTGQPRTLKQVRRADKLEDLRNNLQKNELKRRVLSTVQNYPVYDSRNVKQNIHSLSLHSQGKLRNVHGKVIQSAENIRSGDVFTGSLNTSHSSYLPQLKEVFKYKDGAPQFLGYHPMNSLGFLSDFGYSEVNIAKYLNAEIDVLIKRGILPKDIQRPYVLKNSVMLPHYGIKQFQQGGSFQSGVHTRIPSDVITTKGMSTPLLGVDNFGNQQMMYPGANYIFPGAEYVDEYPMMQIGGESTIENPPMVLPRSTINEYYNFRRENLIDLSLTPEQAREKYTSVNPVLFDAYTFFKNKGWTPVDSSTYHDEDFSYCSSKGCFYDDNSWNTFISANSPAETPIVERPLVTPETSNVQTPEQPPILPVIPLENVPQQVVTPQQPVPTQTPPQQPVQTNQPQVTPAPQQPSETPKSSEPKPKYHKEYNPYTGRYEPMSPKQKIELDGLYSRDLPMPENWQPELIETYRRQTGGAIDWKSRIASTLKLQQGGTPSEIWKQHTGTSWSEAKRQGLTDGSAAQNIALANRVLAGEFGESQISYEDYQNSRAAYDKMVVDKVMRGATLDDLVTQRVGTRSGLINRFPDLFNQQSPQQPKTLPDKPSAKKETTKRNSPVSVKETPVITPPVVKPQQQAPININELREKIKDLKRKNSMAGPTAMLRQYMKDPLKYAKELEALKNFNQVPKQSLHPSLYVDQSTFTPPGAMLPKVSAEVPSLSRRKEQQPIPGGIASKFSNTSTPGFINQDLLRFTEEKRQRDKEEAKGRIPYKEPSFVDGIFKAAGQTYTGGLDIEKGVDEMGVVMNEMGVVIDDYTRNFNSYFDRFLVKKGYKKPDSHVVQAKPTDKIKEVKPEVKNFYEQIEVTGDKHQKALPGSQLLSYRSQWDANKGFTFYNTEPKNKQRDVNKTYTDVEGVGHFILDASPLDGKTYMHPNNFAFINRAVESDNYIPMFESIPNSDGQVIMKYKKPSEMTEEELKALSIFNEYAERAAKAKNKSEKDQIAKEYAEAINYDKVKIVAPLRQYNFDDVDFNSSVKAPNFKQAKYLKTKDGKLTNLLFTDPAKNKYGRFDGVTVSFIFKDSYGNNIVRDFSGTINDIQKEGADIKTKYGLKDNELVIGYHDVGSFSAKPAAVNGKLSVNFFDGYNNDYGTGSALIIPKQK
jgi:hypothetical protein